MGFTLIAGVCGFAAIYAFSTGNGFRSTDATPLGQVPTITPVPDRPAGHHHPHAVPHRSAAGAPTQPADTGGGGAVLPPIRSFNLGGQAIHGGIPHAEQMQQARA